MNLSRTCMIWIAITVFLLFASTVSAIPIRDPDYVVVNDSQVYLRASNITYGGEYLYVDVMYKQLPANPTNVDFSLGVNLSEISLHNGEYYNPHYGNYTTYDTANLYNVTILQNRTSNKTSENITYGHEYNTYQFLISHNVENMTGNGTDTIESIV